MTLFNRSVSALFISLALSACGSDDSGNNIVSPETPSLQPLPTKQISLEIGSAQVDALEESLVINTLSGEEQRIAIETFKGIRYAEQPTRFEHSEMYGLEDGTDATAFGDACPQLKKTTQSQSEDCLNLNIWRPAGLNGDESLPVYVFIHGGDFEYGAGSEPLIHGDTIVAQGTSDNQEFIAITFNYRLGLLGTQWIKGENEDGNYGLGDQKSALAWVNAHIRDFGGNPDNVTVMGQGAGAMSIGFLQQDSDISGTYFQRAIMQSNPYGFDYRNYDKAKSHLENLEEYSDELFMSEELSALPLESIMQVQEKALDPLTKLSEWVSENIADLLIGNGTPMANMKPFAPYLQCAETKLISGCKTDAEQPIKSNFTVPTVLGVNNDEANTVAMFPSLTFLIPMVLELIEDESGDVDLTDPEQTVQILAKWLDSSENIALVQQKLSSVSIQDINLDELSAYGVVTKLFFGLNNLNTTDALLELTDYYPNPENELGGAIKNMSEFKQQLNDMLFAGPSRIKAKQAEENGTEATFYHFDYKPSFNVWGYETKGQEGAVDIIDLINSISCISGACNASELPFVFNKALKLDGTEVHPTSKDKALMAQLSRLWFSDDLFMDYQYNESSDSVMVIDEDGDIALEVDWDRYSQEGIDPTLRNGRLTGLEEQDILLGYMD